MVLVECENNACKTKTNPRLFVDRVSMLSKLECQTADFNVSAFHCQVDCATKISTLFTATATKDQKDRALTTDFNCVLVMNSDTPSKVDQFVSGYCENFMLGGVVPHGCVEVPV